MTHTTKIVYKFREHINTLLLQTVLEVPAFHDMIGSNERRGLSPLFWSNINPYGRFRLDMNTRIDLAAASSTGPAPAAAL